MYLWDSNILRHFGEVHPNVHLHLKFDAESSKAFKKIKQKHTTNKRYADVLLAAMARAGNHIVVTRNEGHFKNLLPKTQIENWVDNKPN